MLTVLCYFGEVTVDAFLQYPGWLLWYLKVIMLMKETQADAFIYLFYKRVHHMPVLLRIRKTSKHLSHAKFIYHVLSHIKMVF